MKRSMAVLAALAIGFTYSPPGTVALAEENENKIVEAEEIAAESKENEEDTTETEDSFIDHLLENLFSIEEEQEVLEDDSSLKEQETEEKEIQDSEAAGLKNLQIPQKFEVVIDPWEMDGRGQIYSEQYLISNTGDTPGILTLSNLVCKPQEQSGVVVRTDKEGLHDSGDKSIYMEMIFRNEERIVFSKESCQYQTELKPGEELSVCFVGEVNENAFGKWENDDIAVSLVYSWELEEKQATDDMKKEEEPGIDEKLEGIKQESVIDREEVEEKEQEDANEENSEESLDTKIKSGISEETHENGMDENAPEEKAQEDINTENPDEKEQKDIDTENLEESLHTHINSENSEEIPETDVNGRQPQEQQNNAGEAEPENEPSDRIDTEPQHYGFNNPSSEAENGQETSETPEEVMPEEERETDTKAEPEINGDGLEIADKEEEEIKSIELLESQKIDVVIDSWIIDEQGKIASKKYLLKNTGETSGTWSFTDLIYKPQEQSGIRICTDQKEVHGEDTKSIYMELVFGNGEKIVLSQKNSKYRVKLKPGEEVSVCFMGEISSDLLETWEEENIAVTAVCSWDMEQTVME